MAGPTAAGKTDVLLKIQSYIQRKFPENGIEVINCDSIQVYRFLDIGSAKPSEELRRRLPHHLVDIFDPGEKFSVGDFVRQCDAIIPQIAARGNIPVVSGGTVFYFKNLLHGLAAIPALSGTYRNELEQLSSAELGERLQALDPESRQRISANDRQRLIRACEVSLETGRPFSDYKTKSVGQMKEVFRNQYRPLVLSLELPREVLYRRINQRVEEMFSMGLEREILKLKKLGYQGGDHGLQGIGYREFFSEGMPLPGEGQDYNRKQPQILEKIQQNSRNYAKRQLTFLRQFPDRKVFRPEDADEMAKKIAEFYFETTSGELV
ncbi:tRNA (adenosine(37)-N6)-dimethylallyltransferase MiaA [Candidatus Haliotispira prima]|uniref:tRNA dimethylallyltransferase n=1 Tax=Candidatus Haliotispira prima TaxID=3034016 RepID=A0ABY8MGK2_9SPIO|nr:tRNA (adenosine(37)-N6)-dimethylallyltransferase MiaA [Candidatus Haliotispira prima]